MNLFFFNKQQQTYNTDNRKHIYFKDLFTYG